MGNLAICRSALCNLNAASQKIGETVQGQTMDGRPILAKVKELQKDKVILDLNHPLAGEELNFKVELMEIEK